MRRLYFLLIAVCFTFSLFANKIEVIYQGPYEIGDWGTVELSSIKFHNLEMGDTIYVYVSKADSTSKGAFQGHEWNTLPGIINGQVSRQPRVSISTTERQLLSINNIVR